MVISSRNPVHSVLFLILAFFNSAGLFLSIEPRILGVSFRPKNKKIKINNKKLNKKLAAGPAKTILAF